MYAGWTKGVDNVSQQNLDKPLIVRDQNTKLIKVNFDPDVCLLISIHFWLMSLCIISQTSQCLSQLNVYQLFYSLSKPLGSEFYNCAKAKKK